MQAIATKYYPCTNFKGSRIKAWCERGSIWISYPHEALQAFKHQLAADALCEKFAKEDLEKYGTPIEKNPWMRPKVGGGMPDHCGADEVFVFLD